MTSSHAWYPHKAITSYLCSNCWESWHAASLVRYKAQYLSSFLDHLYKHKISTFSNQNKKLDLTSSSTGFPYCIVRLFGDVNLQRVPFRLSTRQCAGWGPLWYQLGSVLVSGWPRKIGCSESAFVSHHFIHLNVASSRNRRDLMH